MTREADGYMEDNAVLRVAEIELDSAEQAFSRPPWLGEKVTDDPRYYNASLIRGPFSHRLKPDDP